MFTIKYTNKIKRDVRRIKKRGKDLVKLATTLNLLASGNPMPEKYNDHPLKGNLIGECHIEPNCLHSSHLFPMLLQQSYSSDCVILN